MYIKCLYIESNYLIKQIIKATCLIEKEVKWKYLTNIGSLFYHQTKSPKELIRPTNQPVPGSM